LLMLLATIAVCAEWSLQAEAGTVPTGDCNRWSIVSGIAWGFAIWTSAYESLVLFALVMAVSAFENSKAISARSRRAGWLWFALVIALALLIERRVPSFSIRYPEPLLQNWARTIGELAHVSPVNPIWLRWTGYLLLITPFLIWFNVARSKPKSERTI